MAFETKEEPWTARTALAGDRGGDRGKKRTPLKPGWPLILGAMN